MIISSGSGRDRELVHITKRLPCQKNHLIIKFMRIGVVAIVFLFITSFQLLFASATKSQSIDEMAVTLKARNVSAAEVFKAIEANTPFHFMYRYDEIKNIKNINLFAKKQTIASVLKNILTNTSLTYKQVNNQILIINSKTNAAQYPAGSFLPPNLLANMGAQIVSGKVTSAAGEPLSGVGITVKHKNTGTTTNENGNFSIDVSAGDTLVFSYVGYVPKEIVAGNQTTINIALEPSVGSLEQVVVVGYGTQKKVDLTGAIATVDGEDLAQKPVGQTSAALEGTMPGVTVTQRNGKPGGDGGTIRVRGIGTMSGSDPLVLIDGAEGSINNIDPNLIASVTVLKDAASASIYGSRAANGVILVTTKRAKGRGLSISYNDYFGWQTPTDLPELADATTFMQLTNEAYVNSGRTPLYSNDLIAKYQAQGKGNSDSLPNTNWQDQVLSASGFQQSHFLSVNAGTDKVRLIGAVGYLDQYGIMPNSEFKRLSIRTNADITISKKLSLQFDMQFINPLTTEPGAGADAIVSYMNSISPNKLAVNSNGTWGEGWIGLNPVAYIQDGGLRKTSAPFGSINAGINYKPAEWLTVSVNYAPKLVQTDVNNFTRAIQTYFPDGSPAYKNPSLSSLTVSHSKEFYNNLRGTVTFNKSFGEHNLKVMAGSEENSYNESDFSAFRDNFILPDYPVLNTGSADNMNNSGSAQSWSLLSFFGRVNYNYKEKYLLELNARYDGSSRFAAGKKWGFFPSASAGWRISEEKFFQSLHNTVNEFKIRASWGQLGNQNIGSSLYPFVSSVDIGSYSLGGNIVGVAALNNLANRNITWETTEMSDIGIDLSFFNHLTVTADYYVRKTRDILLQLNIPLITGLTAPFQNAGKVNNKGWDVDVSYNGNAGDFKYSIGVNLSDVKNTVIDMHGINQTNVTVNREGYAMNSIFGLQAEGFFQSDEEIQKSATQYGTLAPGDIKYKDQNGDGVINQNDYVILGGTIPRYTYGAHFNASWKNFDANIFFQGVGKADGLIYGGGLMPFYVTSAGGTVQQMYTDSWRPDNTDAAYPRLVFGGSNNQQVSSFWMKNAAYLRLKNVQLGYTLPKQLASKLKMQSFRVFASAYNFFTWDKFWKGYDVETNVGTAGNYPIVKVFSFGVNANF